MHEPRTAASDLETDLRCLRTTVELVRAMMDGGAGYILNVFVKFLIVTQG